MRLALLTVVVLSVAVIGNIAWGPVDPQAVAAGDASAKAEAIAAFQRLNALPSYRIKWTSPEGTGVAEIVHPDRAHFYGKSAQGSVEIFKIGTESRVHYDFPGAPTGWRCGNGRAIVYFDVDKMQKDTTTEVIRKPDTQIDGTPVHTYADAKTNDTLYVGTQTGLPRRVVDAGNNATADFYDYGAPITITPPPCG